MLKKLAICIGFQYNYSNLLKHNTCIKAMTGKSTYGGLTARRRMVQVRQTEMWKAALELLLEN
jgi:hypothetical protein